MSADDSREVATKRQRSAALDQTSRADLWFYPGEVLADGEMRITLMGTGWGDVVRPDQKGPSLFVELGNPARDSFVFDVGPGCILNYNALGVPRSRMNPIFLSHLHMDHCSDLPFIYGFGPKAGDRFAPLQLHGPSGPDGLGLKHLVEGMRKFTDWHVTSFKTVVMGCEASYLLTDENVHEFPYHLNCGVAYERHGPEHGHIVVKHFPALHIIDGAVSYRREWTPPDSHETLVFVYSGDTLPNEFMIEHGRGADILIHETAPALESLTTALAMPADQALGIVCNSHTPASMLGEILRRTRPGLGVTTHSPVNHQSLDYFIREVRAKWKGPYQLGADFMVFNIWRDQCGDRQITTRMAAPLGRCWPVDIETTESTQTPLDAVNYQTASLFDKAMYSEVCQAFKDGSDTAGSGGGGGERRGDDGGES
jgi:ribonuclease Z